PPPPPQPRRLPVVQRQALGFHAPALALHPPVPEGGEQGALVVPAPRAAAQGQVHAGGEGNRPRFQSRAHARELHGARVRRALATGLAAGLITAPAAASPIPGGSPPLPPKVTQLVVFRDGSFKERAARARRIAVHVGRR